MAKLQEEHPKQPSQDQNHMHASRQRANFFSLPRELREQIYLLILCKPQNTITMLSNHACHFSEISAQQPPLTAVNRQLRHEARRTFYASNVFMADVSTVEDLEVARRWVDAIGDGNVGCLRRVAVCGWTKVPFGEVETRRYVRLVLDLQRGEAVVEGDEVCKEIGKGVEELKEGFRRMILARGGEVVDGAFLKGMLEGFHELCDLW